MYLNDEFSEPKSLYVPHESLYAGVDPGVGGCTRHVPPTKIGKNMIFWHEILQKNI